jgi:hypothetical protein
MRRLSDTCIGDLMLSLATLCSQIGECGRATDGRASMTISHIQPRTADVDVMLIHIFTRDIRDQSWREEMIMNRSDRLAKSSAGGIIANTQVIWVPADRRRFCIPCKGQ